MCFAALSPANRLRCMSLLAVLLYSAAVGCVKTPEPPFVTMRITLKNGDTRTLENCVFHYWWEERGETAFLKPYHLYTKNLIVQSIEPIDNQTSRVRVIDRRLDIESISRVHIGTSPSEPEIAVSLNSGTMVNATDDFPRSLKKGEKTGVADYALFLEGDCAGSQFSGKFKKKIQMLKKIEVLSIDDE